MRSCSGPRNAPEERCRPVRRHRVPAGRHARRRRCAEATVWSEPIILGRRLDGHGSTSAELESGTTIGRGSGRAANGAAGHEAMVLVPERTGRAAEGPCRSMGRDHRSAGNVTPHLGGILAASDEIPPRSRGEIPAQMSGEQRLEGGAGGAGDVDRAGGEDGVVAVGVAHRQGAGLGDGVGGEHLVAPERDGRLGDVLHRRAHAATARCTRRRRRTRRRAAPRASPSARAACRRPGSAGPRAGSRRRTPARTCRRPAGCGPRRRSPTAGARAPRTGPAR